MCDRQEKAKYGISEESEEDSNHALRNNRDLHVPCPNLELNSTHTRESGSALSCTVNEEVIDPSSDITSGIGDDNSISMPGCGVVVGTDVGSTVGSELGDRIG